MSLIIGILTIRPKVRKVEGETVELDLQNSASATHILMENIVDPLRAELLATRKEFNETKREMQLLREALRATNSCEYKRVCPVLQLLREGMRGAEPEENTT